MINLLSPEDKRQIRAARSNTLLLRYNLFSFGALIFLIAAIAVTFLYLSTVKSQAEQTIADSQARVSAYAEVKNEAEQFRSNLTTAKQILDSEVNYTNVVIEISQLLPKGVILQQLNLDASTFGTPTTLAVQAKSYDAALSIKDTFQSSPLFSDVHFRSITTAEGSDYPYTVTLGITFDKEAAK